MDRESKTIAPVGVAAMHQPSPFQQTPYGPAPAPFTVRAGRTDPATSYEQAAKVGRSARAALHRQIALALVLPHPGHTGMDLWEAMAVLKQEGTPNLLAGLGHYLTPRSRTGSTRSEPADAWRFLTRLAHLIRREER